MTKPRRLPPLMCDACGTPVRKGKYRLCAAGCGARLHKPPAGPCIDAHAPICPHYKPDPRAFDDIDLGLIATGATIHALRGDDDALRLLLDTLNPEQLLLVALGGMAGLGLAVRSTPGAEDIATGIALSLQNSIYQTAIEGTQT
ncbi:hypothetical protein [Streptomyces erythrochromogenes]|uniref:hypothetical protein n=1 Tax=Streptomyces erythrochromogenes TaxID=285574 RepID=UPI002250D64F|nr:hypothetical protein [Streptomyces erythrochromogenes]MCX5588181.1 hypothetical protein [Streptomyces erythrochromogenes]